jgi:hypothetical protein
MAREPVNEHDMRHTLQRIVEAAAENLTARPGPAPGRPQR